MRWTKENIEKIENEYNRIIGSMRSTGIKPIDDIFGPLVPGSMYLICAGTGVGKSSFLLAAAKKLARDGNNVLYITIEQNITQLKPYMPQEPLENLNIEELTDWKQLKEFATKEQYDYIVFDYLGGEVVDDPAVMVNKTGQLAELAKQTNTIILTACQSSLDLTSVYKGKDRDVLLMTPLYIAFSKHMADKIAGGIYLINDGGTLYMFNFKNRYAPIQPGRHLLRNLNLTTKEFE